MTNPITENMTFNNYLVLTFYMQNLTSGTQWGIKLMHGSNLIQWNNGTGNYIIFEIPGGSYSYLVTGVSSYPQSNSISVSGSMTILLQYKVTTYQIEFKENNLQPGQAWSITVSSSIASYTEASTSGFIYFYFPNGTYFYASENIVGYISNQSAGSLTVDGKDIIITVNFTEGNPFILMGIRNFVAISLNTTDFSIPAGTQIPINVNWTKYSTYENANLSNVMVLNSTFYPLFSWIQNNASSIYKNSTVWVKLDQGIPDYSSQTLYLVFMQRQRNNFNPAGYWGEAPQLSPIYNEWNNIAQVMEPGLLLQIYVNYSSPQIAPSAVQLVSSLTEATFSNGSYFVLSGVRYYAKTGYFTTHKSGSVREIYADSGGGYTPFTQETNVIVDYQTTDSNTPGTWPSPPINVGTMSSSWFAKAVGFVQMNNQQTNFYELDDDGAYLSVTNKSGNYLNSWPQTGNMFSFIGSSGGVSSPVKSSQTGIQGTSEISFLYNQYSTEALWQFWSSAPVTFYHPNPVNDLPKLISNISFGAVASSYSSFYEYGLPVNTNWTVAISGPGFSKLITTDSNLLYTYLSDGTYLYTVGSMVNGSYHSGIDGNFIPSPESGHVIVTGTFTVQVITFSINEVLKYNLDPEQASGSADNVTLPILAVNIQGLPAGNTTISQIIAHLTAKLIAKNQSLNQNLSWSLSSSKYGMIVIFLHIGKVLVRAVQEGTAVVSFVAAFQLGTISEVAAGVAGPSTFANVNTSSPPPPTGLNFTSPSSFLSSLNKELDGIFGHASIIVHIAEIAAIIFAVVAAIYMERIRRMSKEAEGHVKHLRGLRRKAR